MDIEIERKFLVLSDDYKSESHRHYDIIQGFLNRDKHRTVRVRIKADEGFLTVKGISSKDGLSRLEWEQKINLGDAKELLNLCEGKIIRKTRFEVKIGFKLFEVDEFHGEHEGLCIAEIELSQPDEHFERPKWLGKEVTGNKAYYNSQL